MVQYIQAYLLGDIAGLAPDHSSKGSITIKQVVIFFAGGQSCLQFVKTYIYEAQQSKVQ